ncbi:MAG: hypothetical protein ABIT38_03215 [Gemmatimonadaceae bacterium]
MTRIADMMMPEIKPNVEQASGVRLHGVLADRKLLGYLAIAQTGRDKLQDFKLARSDAELFDTF